VCGFDGERSLVLLYATRMRAAMGWKLAVGRQRLHTAVLRKRKLSRMAWIQTKALKEWSRCAEYLRLTRGRVVYGVSLCVKHRRHHCIKLWLAHCQARRRDFELILRHARDFWRESTLPPIKNRLWSQLFHHAEGSTPGDRGRWGPTVASGLEALTYFKRILRCWSVWQLHMMARRQRFLWTVGVAFEAWNRWCDCVRVAKSQHRLWIAVLRDQAFYLWREEVQDNWPLIREVVHRMNHVTCSACLREWRAVRWMAQRARASAWPAWTAGVHYSRAKRVGGPALAARHRHARRRRCVAAWAAWARNRAHAERAAKATLRRMGARATRAWAAYATTRRNQVCGRIASTCLTACAHPRVSTLPTLYVIDSRARRMGADAQYR